MSWVEWDAWDEFREYFMNQLPRSWIEWSLKLLELDVCWSRKWKIPPSHPPVILVFWQGWCPLSRKSFSGWFGTKCPSTHHPCQHLPSIDIDSWFFSLFFLFLFFHFIVFFNQFGTKCLYQLVALLSTFLALTLIVHLQNYKFGTYQDREEKSIMHICRFSNFSGTCHSKITVYKNTLGLFGK